jgi:hypothetical protein
MKKALSSLSARRLCGELVVLKSKREEKFGHKTDLMEDVTPLDDSSLFSPNLQFR